MLASLARRFLVGCFVAAAMFAPSAAAARNFGLGTGYDTSEHAPLFSVVRAKLIHDGYRPVQLQHDHRDLCRNMDWSHVCTRFPETLDCSGAAQWGECDFVYQRPEAEVAAHGQYLLVSTSMHHRGRAVVHEQPADSEDLEKIAVRKDLNRKGCGERPLLEIRVCDLAWPPSSKPAAALPPAFLPGRFWRDPEHGIPYALVRARLVSEGYRPAKLQHDERDACTSSYSRVCNRYAETFDCKWSSEYEYCEFAFERPRDAWASRGPYLVVQAAMLDEGTIAVHQEIADTNQLMEIWARKNLARRGCEKDRLLQTRNCDLSWSPRDKEPPAPAVPVLPPLPPSAK